MAEVADVLTQFLTEPLRTAFEVTYLFSGSTCISSVTPKAAKGEGDRPIGLSQGGVGFEVEKVCWACWGTRRRKGSGCC